MSAERRPGVPKIIAGGTGSFPFCVVWRELRPAGPVDPSRDTEIAFCRTIPAAYEVCEQHPAIWEVIA